MSSFVSATEKMTIRTILMILSVLLFILITVQTAHSNDSKDLSQTEVSNASFSDLERGPMLTHTDRYKEKFGKLYLASRGGGKSHKCFKTNCPGGFTNCDQCGTCKQKNPICCCKEGGGDGGKSHKCFKTNCPGGFTNCDQCGTCKGKKPICCCKGGGGGGGGGGEGGSSAEQVGLKWHNYYRNIHEARQMKLNSGMNGGAMGFAKELARLGDFPGHRPPPGQGENVGVQCRSGSDADLVKAVVESWYKEACAYFKCPQFSGVTGHFTQLVWKESTELGIGFARGTFKGFKDCLWVVGRYRKAGNVMGQLFQNVVKGSFNCGDVCRK